MIVELFSWNGEPDAMMCRLQHCSWNLLTASALGLALALTAAQAGAAHRASPAAPPPGEASAPPAVHEPDAAAKPFLVARAKAKRYGIEGKILDFDSAKNTVKVEIKATKVSGGFGTGGVAGKKPPRKLGLKRGQELDFQVQPEGSVLRRTVIKAMDGSGLDTTGTREGFVKALSMIPDDRAVVISFEQNDKAAIGNGAPDFSIKMIQIRLTEDELRERFEANSVEE